MREFIPDIPAIAPEPDANLGHIWSLHALLDFLGQPVDLAWIVGISGEPTRFYEAGREVSRTAPHAGTEYSLMRALGAVGRRFEHYSGIDADELFALVATNSTARGPLLGRSTEGDDRWGVIAGYDTDGQRILARNMNAPAGDYDEIEAARMVQTAMNGGEVLVVEDAVHASEPREVAIDALAHMSARYFTRDPGGGYVGPLAYETYISCMDNCEFMPGEFGEESYAGEDRRCSLGTNMVSYNLETWAKIKPWGSEFVEATVAEFEEPAREHIERAADRFDIVARNWDALRLVCGRRQQANLMDPMRSREVANMLRDAVMAETVAMRAIQDGLRALGEGMIRAGHDRCERVDDAYSYQAQADRLQVLERPDEAATYREEAGRRR